jgi:hypothetical protein
MASKKPKEQLFPNDFWARPSPSMSGDPDPSVTFAAVGQALSMWELIEEQLASLCLVFSGLAEDGKLNTAYRRLFGSIESSSARRAAILEAAAVYFLRDKDGTMFKKLDALLRQVSDASRRRDDIAHGIVSKLTTNRKSVGAFLLPSGYNSARNKIYATHDRTVAH